MFARSSQALLGSCVVLFSAGIVLSQAPAPTPKVEPLPAPNLIAARVNGHAISELMVYRSLMGVPPQRHDEARKDLLNYLIENTIVDQYLVQLKIQIEPKEIDENIKKIKDEAAKDKRNYQDILKKLSITEEELRTELTRALRWDKFVLKQGPDKVLQQFFTQNSDMFNGRRLRARHILIPIKDNNKDSAFAKITAIKKSIDAEVGQIVAKLPSTTDSITREKERANALEQAFIKAAQADSTCPSKKDGGDLGYFPRVGAMVEPFARAAFALKQFQMSEPVATEFGYHLILAIDFKEGKDKKFEEVKPFVQEVYGERLREAILAAYKPKAKIEIVERKK
jgi:peptidyl-prolyl cis-trans isomerase C